MGILFILVCNITSPFSFTSQKEINHITKNHVIIKIAILDSVIPSFTSPTEMEEILNKYSWKFE